jgi:DNA-binding GntR family transcriptional regulator
MVGDQAKNRTSKIVQEITEFVLSGKITPGHKLDEQMLADRFKVSRTPVREALRQVANTGLIEIKPNRGAFVASATPGQLEEMFAAMAELEATCARLAAMSMTPKERHGLRRLQESMGELARRDLVQAFVEANDQFHSLIYDGAHNEILRDITVALRRRLIPYRHAQFRSSGRLPRSLAEHDEVVKAVVSGDPDGAHKAMLHHVGLVEAAFEKLITEVPF